MASDESSSAAQVPRSKPWYRSVTISLSAFVMSLTATLISAFSALKGAEINVRPPKQVVIYLNDTGTEPVTTVIMSLDFINDSADQSDVILEASLTIHGRDATVPFNGLARFAPGADASKCNFGASCAPVSGFIIETTPDTLIELPKGAARSATLSFPIDPATCSGRQCSAYESFGSLRAALEHKPIIFNVKLSFHGDGERNITCRTGPLDESYLTKARFTSMACVSSGVSGAPFF